MHETKKNLKLIYKVISSDANVYEDKRIVSKILKMGENNQYGNALTKLLPTGSIKRQKKPTLRELDLMIQGISDEDSIAPLFIVDIESDQKKPTEETLLFNEIYMPIIEKKGSFAQ